MDDQQNLDGGSTAAAAGTVSAGSGFAPETITLPGSGLVFDNTYGAGVTAAYRAAIIAAENFYQQEFTNSVTLDASFDLQALNPSFAGENSFNTVDVSYSTLLGALQAHATTPLQQEAVAALPATDPSGGKQFGVSIGMADILGIAGSATSTDAVVLNSLYWTSFGQDAVAVIEHELSEGALGRIGSLGYAIPGEWAPMDLFRYSAMNTPDYTGGQDGKQTFFSVDGSSLSTQDFHNSINASGQSDGFDLADWDNTIGDSFGPGGPGYPGTLSATDLQILNVLGYDPTPPVLSAPSSFTIGEHRTVALPIAVTPANAGDSISVTLSGIPGGVAFSDSGGALTVTNGTITLDAAQLAGLSITSGSTATTGTITIAAEDATTGSANSTTQFILGVDPSTINSTTVTNTVSLTGGYYLYNSPSGLINVSGTAVLGTGAPNDVVNAGTIEGTGTAGIGIDLTTGGSVTNDATASIIGGAGIDITGSAGTVVNFGTVQSTGVTAGLAVYFGQGGVFTNETAAQIASVRNGVEFLNAVGTVTNYGTIASTGTNSTIYLGRGGLITNGASGSNAATIVGNKTAIAISSPTIVP